MFRTLILAVLRSALHKVGLHTRAEYDQLLRGTSDALEAIAHETARASVYAAALIHNVDDEPHLTVEADAALEHARGWLHNRLGRGSGDVLTGARDLLAAVDEHEAALDQAAVERIHDALADLDAATVTVDKELIADLEHAYLVGAGQVFEPRGIHDHWMDDLIGYRR